MITDDLIFTVLHLYLPQVLATPCPISMTFGLVNCLSICSHLNRFQIIGELLFSLMLLI
jgi:hypothetical protein